MAINTAGFDEAPNRAPSLPEWLPPRSQGYVYSPSSSYEPYISTMPMSTPAELYSPANYEEYTCSQVARPQPFTVPSPPTAVDDTVIRETLPPTLLRYILELLKTQNRLPSAAVRQDETLDESQSDSLKSFSTEERTFLAWHLKSQLALLHSIEGFKNALNDQSLTEVLSVLYDLPQGVSWQSENNVALRFKVPHHLISWLSRELSAMVFEVRAFIIMRNQTQKTLQVLREAFAELCRIRIKEGTGTADALSHQTTEKEHESSSTSKKQNGTTGWNALNASRPPSDISGCLFNSNVSAKDVGKAIRHVLRQMIGSSSTNDRTVEQVMANPVAMTKILENIDIGNERKGATADENKAKVEHGKLRRIMDKFKIRSKKEASKVDDKA